MTVATDVGFPYGGGSMPGFLARPDGTGPFPGIVVIHEAYGLTDQIRRIARRFAEAGYAALAVDLFAGGNRALCMARVMVSNLVRPLENGAVAELRAALSYLAALPEVDARRLGAVGYCMGGGLAIAWACTDNRLRAIAPYYGANPRPFAAVARLCPVVGSYPERDFTARSGRRLDAALDRHGVPHDIKIYPGARHSFFNEEGHAYDPAAAQDSWERVLAFFAERFGPSAGAD
jgi:carboxymethylenebutenolidase